MSSIRKSSRARLSGSSASHAKVSKKQELADECMYPRTGRRGAPQVFPRKLYQILDEVDDDVISWTNKQGTSFIIHDMDYFTENVLLNYFRHQKYSSFQRQLNLYGFHKIAKGPETGAYAHDCFLRDKPELLMGVRRLPQRVAASISKKTKSSHKIVINISPPRVPKEATSTKKQGAFSRLASCLKPRPELLQESSSEESTDSYYEEEEEDYEHYEPTVNVPNHGFGNVDDSDFFGCESEQEEAFAIENLEQDRIVRVQPLPKVCILDESARVDGLANGVNQLALERSPIATAKTISVVTLPESSRAWAVKMAPPMKPQSPNSGGGLQSMIPMLVRASSSAFAFGKEVKSCGEDDMKSVMDDLKNLEANATLGRSKSSSVDSEKDLMPPPSMNQRLSSEAWNLSSEQELQAFFSGKQLDNIFIRQESADIIIPPKVVEMER